MAAPAQGVGQNIAHQAGQGAVQFPAPPQQPPPVLQQAPPFPVNRAPFRRPGQQQHAYVVNANVPADPAIPPLVQNAPQGDPYSNQWSFYGSRAQKCRIEHCPLSLLRNPKKGLILPTYIYTRPTVGLTGSELVGAPNYSATRDIFYVPANFKVVEDLAFQSGSKC